MNKHFVVFGLIAISLFTLVATSPSSVSADWLLDRTGSLIKIDPRILGDDDTQEVKVENQDKSDDTSTDNDDSKDDPSSSPTSESSTSNEQQKKEQERVREQAKKQAEIARKASDKAKEELKKKIEINQIKSRTNKIEKESEIEVEGDKIKIKQKIKDANGKETETEMQLENGEELQIESKDGEESKKFKLRAREDDGMEVEKDGVKVSTKLPISINENNELVVTRPDGTTKVVAFMPDEALKMLRDQNITPIVPGSSDDTLQDNMPVLEEEDGESVYKIDGEKEEKVFGLFKVSYKTKSIVSAETGELVRTELSGFDRFMSLFSF